MKQMMVHCEAGITQVAIMEQGQLVEYYAETPEDKQSTGNVYAGKVVNVLPGMQAAFINIGHGKNAFLYVDDVLHPHLEKQPKVKPSISELLRVGQDVIVQVMKEPIGGKGARVTTHYSFPGHYLVYMPTADYIGISKRIEQPTERARLKETVQRLLQPGEGVIVRTRAEGESEESLDKDLTMLRGLWNSILEQAERTEAPAELYQEPEIVSRLVRDIVISDADEIIIDDPERGEAVRRMAELAGIRVPPVKVWNGPVALFRHYPVMEQLDQLLQPKIRLASGGYIVLDQTEALTIFDVNTGKFTGTDDFDTTIFQTNKEAAEMIARLLRLFDLGGIIIVDFIDMLREEHRNAIVELMEERMKPDRTKHMVVGWTKLGLLEMTRKKVRDTSMGTLISRCAACGGTGRIYPA
jgi:ribonuclease G